MVNIWDPLSALRGQAIWPTFQQRLVRLLKNEFVFFPPST